LGALLGFKSKPSADMSLGIPYAPGSPQPAGNQHRRAKPRAKASKTL
jgi:hypothetical protein